MSKKVSKVTAGLSTSQEVTNSQIQSDGKSHADVHWPKMEPDFTSFEPLALNFGPQKRDFGLTRRKQVIIWSKSHFIWIVYFTMIIQLGANVGVVSTLPSILKSDVRYVNVPLTQHVLNSQTTPMLAAIVITHLILGEWYYVRHRSYMEQGDVLGIVGVLLLFITAVSIDACRLIQAHIQLVQLRLDDGRNTSNYNTRCFETYMELVNDLDLERITITPVQNLINHYQCCSGNKSVAESRILFAPLQAQAGNMTMEKLITNEGFRCCKTDCQCNAPTGTFTICLTKFLQEMSHLYASTYPIYIVFVLASISSCSAFLFYNNQVANWN